MIALPLVMEIEYFYYNIVIKNQFEVQLTKYFLKLLKDFSVKKLKIHGDYVKIILKF